MGSMIELTTSDGHTLGAYKAELSGTPKGGVVVIQEIFGVNQHIKNVADQYAAAGYLAIAPALFDRVEKGLELGYGQEDFGKGRDTRGALDNDGIQADVPGRDQRGGIGRQGRGGRVLFRRVRHLACGNKL